MSRSAAQPLPGPQAGQGPGAGLSTQPVSVLVVDDQAPFRSAARAVVAMVGSWRVVAEAGSGEEALALADEHAPQVVLMDLTLPGMSGIEASRALTARHPEAVVVLVSTYAYADLPSDAGDCGARGYIRKDDLTPRLLRRLVEG